MSWGDWREWEIQREALHFQSDAVQAGGNDHISMQKKNTLNRMESLAVLESMTERRSLWRR